MATITPVDIGAAPDDGNGDPLRTAFSKLNANDTNINTELAGKALASHTHTLADVTDSGALAALATVDTGEIDDNAVTLAKLADVATSTFLGRITAATGDPEVLTPTQARTILNVEDGSAADQNAAEVSFTPAGGLSSTDVQNALEELDTEKSGTSHTHTLTDVTDSGALAALDTVDTPQIDNNAVTLPKLVDIATQTILGRTTAATGDPEALTATQARGVLNVEDGAAAPPYDTADLANNAVTLAKFQDIATASILGRTTAATGDPEVLTAAQTRTVLNVENGANAPPFVTSDYQDESVTLAKLADMATASLLGRDTAGSGVPEVLSATTVRAILNVEDGAKAPPFDTADYNDASVTFAKIQNVSAQWRVLGRISSGAGVTEEIDVSALTDQTSPAGTDVVLAERASDGNLVKIQVGNFPTGGGGEANLGANLGAGIGVFEGKSGVTLQFNSLVSQNTALTIAEDDANDEIDFDLDINAATDLVAPATGDELLIGDISDSNNVKKADLASVVNLADHDALTNFISDEHVAHTGVTLTAGTGLTGGGDISANRSFAVDINGTADLPAPAAGDELLVSDTSDTNTVKKADLASIVNLADHDALTNFVADEHVAHAGVTLTAGDGLSGGGTIAASRTFDVDITGTTDLVAPAVADEILISDADNSNAIRKADVASVVNLADHDALTNFAANEHVDHTSVTLTAGDALSGGGTIAANRTFNLDISGTTDLAAPAVGDELVLGDISNGNAIRKADVASVVNLADHDSLTNFVADEHVAHTSVTLTAGDGLAGGGDISSNRTFDVDINGTTDLAAPATGDELLLGDISNADAIRKADVASVVNLADHDALTNFVADEHVAHGSVTLTAGDGLSGGGTIAANRTFDVDISGATDDATPARSDEILIDDGAIKKSDIGAVVDLAKPVESFIIAVSDETTALTTGTAKVTFRMPYAFTLSDVRSSVTTAPTGSVLTVDLNEGGTTILSTKLTIDATEKTSTTAATAAVISDSALADDAEITIDVDAIGSTIAGAGLKVTLIGRQT